VADGLLLGQLVCAQGKGKGGAWLGRFSDGVGFQPKEFRRIGKSFSIFESFYKMQTHLNSNEILNLKQLL
jgi:hypothetical protein